MSKNKPRSDGRYQSKVYVGNIDGKPTYKYVYAETNKELQRKILELKSKLGKGVDIRADRESFDYWGRKWLDLKAYEVSENWKKALDCNYKKLEGHSIKFCVKAKPIRQSSACKTSGVWDFLLIALIPRADTVCAPKA